MMRKFKNAAETLDALEEELLRMKKDGARLKIEFVPCAFIVALYRLAQTQIALERHASPESRSWEDLRDAFERFARHDSLGSWIAEQPE
mgnify:CR=1 FL=1